MEARESYKPFRIDGSVYSCYIMNLLPLGLSSNRSISEPEMRSTSQLDSIPQSSLNLFIATCLSLKNLSVKALIVSHNPIFAKISPIPFSSIQPCPSRVKINCVRQPISPLLSHQRQLRTGMSGPSIYKCGKNAITMLSYNPSETR